ncbi:glycosyl hydrolase [Dyadobacter fermentans]|uniref:Glycoside hydrolase family 2 sugar binding n=1 Tax=Dyadobacter fermentans (strain ATCC 700827 / DSM 18053 / CIP 107007 / KCTC 52180 / NS114) TaxID=471854 RepID=C6VRR3_DYAFD|nr:glycosyl hydrolase [Dyadobacter fermentans]ACT92766.1 glycoside hydrolase family 2 sugar binding [Dyadobacter fermentans DSM 18053]
MKKLILLAWAVPALAWGQSPALQQGFQTPPDAAKPRVWWHWMNGNITKEGITKDLEWMKRVGIGGFQNFDASLFTPNVTPKKLVFMTPDWKDAFKHTTDLAQKLGLEMAIAGSPGWSVTGGPWVPAADAMKKYVWTETHVPGGQTFTGKLPPPAPVAGKFQNVPLPAEGGMSGPSGEVPDYYADALVIAYKLPSADKRMSTLNPKVTSSGGSFSVAELTDGDLGKTSLLPPMEVGQDMWVQYEFDTPQTFKALTIVGASSGGALAEFNGAPNNRTLRVSDDGVTFRDVAPIKGSIVPQNTLAFTPVTARFYRIAFKTLAPPFNPFVAMMGGGGGQPAAPEGVHVAEIVFHNTDRMDQFEEKAGFSPWRENTSSLIQPNADAVPLTDVIDLTSKMTADGSLNWTPPAGNWVVVRLGYSLTGRKNHPASPEATGLEVDKLDKAAVTRYINTYLDMYKDATGGQMGAKGLQFMVLDSYEAGHMTWTKEMPQEFKKRRGYDITPWIPALTGIIVKSAAESDRFLWDFRKTIGELIIENHYEVIGDALKARGMKRYTESHEGGRIYLADGMDVKRKADIPMAAMWTPGSLAGGADEEVRSEADIRESASVAHIYGQNIVAAESMTSVGNAFTWYPEKLKRTADLEMASGLNRFVIHTSVHQPLDDKKPGFSLGPFGQYFTRQETWAEQAKAWMDYLGRSCFMLQQGKPVVDVLYYYGENSNITQISTQKLPPIPAGYAFDFANSSVIKDMLKIEKGLIATPSGQQYRLLVLDSTARDMTLPVLQKIGELVDNGMKVAGVKPERSPSLGDDPSAFTALVNRIWNNPNVSSQPLETVLSSIAPKDVAISGEKAKILYVHRQTPDADIYWLDNRSNEANQASISFRVTGKIPVLWNPETGKTSKVFYQIADGRTTIPLKFDSWQAYFIVFSGKAPNNLHSEPEWRESDATAVTGTWTVRFQPGLGAPAQAQMNELASLSEHADAGIKYFSGTATYENTLNVSAINKKARYWLHLGDVKNLAEVIVNGKNAGIIWKKPFRIDITDAVKRGANSIQVRVTNTWVNRLIGDAQPGTATKITYTTMPFYKADSPLQPSGLLGPVKLVAATPAK